MKKHPLGILSMLVAIMLIVTGCPSEPSAVTSVTLDSTEISIEIGSSVKLTATLSPADATVGTGIIWSSDKAETATVDKEGNVTAVAVGEAVITATTENGLKATCKVTVKAVEVTGIKLSAETLVLEKDDTADLRATITPDNATDRTITWESSVPAVATVENGKVTALSVGETIITAKSANGKEASCSVKVNPISAKSISFAEATAIRERGEFKVDPIFTPEDTADKTVTWTSSNQDAAAVSEDGTITAKAAGTTTIKAVQGKLEAEFILEVVDIINTPGNLENTLADKELTNAASLRIAGSLNESDYVYLRSMESLKTLDMKLSSDTEMPEGALSEAKSIETVILPENLTAIPNYCFTASSTISSVTIPNSVTAIGAAAFAELSQLQSITLPSNLETIDNAAFVLTGLTEISIPESVSFIGESAFQECTALASLTISEGITAIPDNLCWHATGLTNLTLPSTLETIGNWAFNSTNIDSLAIPDSVTSIGEQAFWGCANLQEVTLGSGLLNIGPAAFCEAGITELTFSPDSQLTTIGNDAFYGIEVSSLVLPDTVTSIGDYAFCGLNNITELTLPANLETIGKDSFLGCSNLKTLTMPSGLKSIGEEAFKQCPLEFAENTLDLPASLETIGKDAFGSIHGITSVIMHDRLTTIKEGAFLNLYGVKEFTIPASVTKMTDAWPIHATKMTFEGTTPPELILSTLQVGEEFKIHAPNREWMKDALVYVPTGSEETYKASTWFKDDQYVPHGYQPIPCFKPENVNKE